jgi:hypothetical protein
MGGEQHITGARAFRTEQNGPADRCFIMGELRRHGSAQRLRRLWRERRGATRLLVVAAGILLVCAPGFIASEVAALSSVRLVSAQRPAVVRLSAGTYDISQDARDDGFPDDPIAVSVSGPAGWVVVRAIPQVLTPEDPASVFLGAWDCDRVMSFTISRAGSYQVSVASGSGMSAAWISEPYATVAWQVFPWAFGIVMALPTMAVCLIICAGPWRRARVARMSAGRCMMEG